MNTKIVLHETYETCVKINEYITSFNSTFLWLTYCICYYFFYCYNTSTCSKKISIFLYKYFEYL